MKKTVERMMFAVHRSNTVTNEEYGAVYVAETKSEAQKWLNRELRENSHLDTPEFTHEIKYEKWNWHK